MDKNDNLDNWIKCWKESARNAQIPFDESRTAEMWNKRSDTFGMDRKSGRMHKRTENIFAMLKEAGFNPEGAKVLDIGCGPGTLAIPLAKAGAEVTAIDIASGMLDRLRATAKEENLNIDARELSWWTADIDDLGFRKQFDLVLASMTPSINGVESFEKMISCSKGLCYYSNFVRRGQNPAHEEIRKLLEPKDGAKRAEDRPDHPPHGHSHGPGNGLFFPFMYLYLNGYCPDVKIVNSEHMMEKGPEDAAERTIDMMSRDRTLDEETQAIIRNYYKTASENGTYSPSSSTYTGMMVWKI
ncbi:class I SAM-dependent methyltransferase [Methanolacinia paynteri]|uniref:class I SAM-dependent methyltransferase n=1 Tax=Methanolacinia paynteri TaxID=230356 RepID=UPI00064FB909|nr:methyltransferase domain-containing protein [Methanolacinia paynteri]